MMKPFSQNSIILNDFCLPSICVCACMHASNRASFALLQFHSDQSCAAALSFNQNQCHRYLISQITRSPLDGIDIMLDLNGAGESID